jgi:hypothetical protein
MRRALAERIRRGRTEAMNTMELLTTIPPLDSLPNPHLVVVGDWWSSAGKVIAARLEGNAPLVYLADRDARDVPGQATIDGKRTDLIRMLSGGADSLANLRALLVPLAAEAVHGSAEASAAVAAIFDELMIMGSNGSRRPIAGIGTIAVRFPAAMRPSSVCAAIDDMIDHATATGLPMPVARIDQRGSFIRRDVRETRIAVAGGRIAPAAVTVSIAVRTSSDWKPYETLGLIPDIPVAVIAAERELEEANLRRNPAYGNAPDDALRDLARCRIGERLWHIALSRAGTADALEAGIGSLALLEALRGNDHSRHFSTQIQEVLSGDKNVPAWWSADLQMVACHDCHGLRTAILIESMLEQAAQIPIAGTAKFVVIEASIFHEQPLTRSVIERLLRIGRKHHVFTVILTPSFGSGFGLIGDLTANWLVAHDVRSLLPFARVAPDAVERDPPPHGWWQSSLSPLPQPVGRWFTSEEVAAGDRLLAGVSHAHA